MNYNKPFQGSLGKKEELSSESRTETAGFITAEKRILSLINAGQRLSDYRESQFDFTDEKSVDMDFYDPTREPGFDLADASMLANDLNNKMQAEELEKASQTVYQTSQEPQTPAAGETPAE